MQVLACWWHDDQNSLFFETIPDLQPDAGVIARVALLNVTDHGTATAKVLQVLKTSDESIRQGTIVTMSYVVTSCGPSPANSTEGTIIANTGSDKENRLVLYPYLRSRGGRITFPSQLE